MSEMTGELEALKSRPPNARKVAINEIRRIVRSTGDDEHPGTGDSFRALVLDVIADLVDAADAHDWKDVDRIEIEAREGTWRATIHIARNDDSGHYVCARGRQRGWR